MKDSILEVELIIKKLEQDLLKKNTDKKYLKKQLKEQYKILKMLYKSCAKDGHNFSEWEDISYIEQKEYSDPYSLYKGYYDVIYPLHKRSCIECGYEEVVQHKPKEKKKNI